MSIVRGNDNANLLNGIAEADLIYAYAGNDTIYVHSASDTVTDSGGWDTIRSYAGDWRLTNAATLENLVLAGSAVFGFGNALGNDDFQVV